jgi:hypothetical protein
LDDEHVAARWYVPPSSIARPTPIQPSRPGTTIGFDQVAGLTDGRGLRDEPGAAVVGPACAEELGSGLAAGDAAASSLGGGGLVGVGLAVDPQAVASNATAISVDIDLEREVIWAPSARWSAPRAPRCLGRRPSLPVVTLIGSQLADRSARRQDLSG